MMLGNTELNIQDLFALQRCGVKVEVDEDESTVYLTLGGVPVDYESYVTVVRIVAAIHPDACDLVDGKLRLWWD